MYKFSSIVILFLYCLCIFGAGKTLLELENTESHLDRYSYVNRTHHDNIDDVINKHSHGHKHNKDGEEHEHNHEHKKITQCEVNLINQIKYDEIVSKDFQTTQGFFEKNLVSSPHLMELFKPPIA